MKVGRDECVKVYVKAANKLVSSNQKLIQMVEKHYKAEIKKLEKEIRNCRQHTRRNGEPV